VGAALAGASINGFRRRSKKEEIEKLI